MPGVHFASERLAALIHITGTHVDAPWHYGPRSAGQPARTIDQMPPEWFFGDAVVLDFSRQQDGGSLTEQDLVAALGDYRVKSGDIVLLRTDLDKSPGGREALVRLRELTRPAAEYLLDRGVRVIGIDAETPERSHVEELKAGQAEAYFPVHCLGREREFCLVEMLTNLHLLPHHGFQVALFPIKIERGSGGWCRAVAFLPD